MVYETELIKMQVWNRIFMWGSGHRIFGQVINGVGNIADFGHK